MASFKELIKKSLNELVEDDLKEFQWHLENDHECISKSDMENADRLKTVNKMVDRFGPEESVKIMVEILRKINQNNLAKQLENKLKQAQAEGSIEDPAPVGAISKPMWVTFTNIVPRTRNDFLQYYHHFTLDPNTAYKLLRLFERNRAITKSEEPQPYPDHPDRFDECRQVLCRESVCGRCYWEVEWSGCVRISVSYKSIRRKGEGNECKFGYNDQSWSLDSSHSRYSFRHNDIVTKLPTKSIIRRIGVYVDHSAGTLSFYSVSGDTMTLIHTVQTTFSQPLYPGFRLHVAGSFVKLC